MDLNGDATAPTAGDVPVSRLVDVLRRVHGLDISRYSDAFLAGSFGRRWQSAADMTAESYLQHLSRDKSEAEVFVRFLRIHHSEFFRDPLAFTLLEQRLLPGLANVKAASNYPELRVWSAGCASGEEAYSIAILLRESCDGLEGPVRFRIFATDSSEEQLKMALAGAYAASALGNVNLRHLERWFFRRDNSYVVVPELRECIDFSVHDLCDDRISAPSASIFGEFDLVFCCNLLFYYSPVKQELILDRLRRCLSPDGFLVTDEAEREIVRAAGFRPLAVPAPIFQAAR
jgi:chemotaxis methyl-accepting protein methylase